jgi:hypothetical protein
MTPAEPPVWVTYVYEDFALILSGELDSVWAYLTYRNEIIADCLLVTTLPPEKADEADKDYYASHDAPPPLTSDYASNMAWLESPTNEHFRVLWSPEGREALVALNNQVHAYISADEDMGYSKALSQDGQFGQAWRDFPVEHINQPSTAVHYE